MMWCRFGVGLVKGLLQRAQFIREVKLFQWKGKKKKVEERKKEIKKRKSKADIGNAIG